MVAYDCKICNFSSKLKPNYNRHLKTKKHLNNEKKIVVSEENKPQCAQIVGQCTQKNTEMCTNDTQMCTKNKEIELNKNCELCGKTFKYRQSMLRHTRLYCKKKKELDKEKNEKNELHKIIKSQTKQINKLLEKNGKQINNTQNNNNSNNTINNTIHINNYGEENLEMLTDEFKERCITRPFYAIIDIIRKIHFNDDYPENKNMRIVNKRDNKIQVLTDGKWQYRYKDEAVKYAFDDSNERLEQFYVEKSHKFRKFIKLCCEDIIKNIHECEHELMKELYKEMDLILLNGC